MAGVSRLQGRRRTSGIWPLTVYLVLSHSVWSSLQCMSKASQSSSNPPSDSIVNIPGEDYDPSLSPSSGEERSDDLFIGGSSNHRDPYFVRNGRPDADNEKERLKDEVFHFCQRRLTDELNKVCEGQYHDPNTEYPDRSRTLSQALEVAGRRSFVKRGEMQVLLRRVPRSLVDECCKKPCRKSHVQRYCKQGNGRNSTSEMDQNSREENELKPGEDATVHQLGKSGESESALYYPLLHIFKFIHEHLGPSSTPPSPPVYEEEEERELPIPQARVQDKHFDKPTYASSARPRNNYHHHRVQPPPTSFSDRNENDVFQPFANNQNAGFRGPKVAQLLGASYNNPAFASSHRSSFAGSKPNHIHYQFHTFQDSEQSSGERWGHKPKVGRNGTTTNVVTSTLPPEMINLGSRTVLDDYSLQ